MVLLSTQQKSVEIGAQYKLPSTSSIVSRNLVKVLPSNGTSFEQNNQITIQIPSVNFLDVSGSYLSFIIDTAATKTLVSDNSQAWIERLRVSSGNNEVLYDIMSYNILNGITETLLSNKIYKENAGDVLEGTKTVNTRVLQTGEKTGQRRCIQLLGGILDNNSTYFPLKYTNGLIIDIFVASDSKVSTEGLKISDVSYACEFLEMDSQYTAAFEEQFLTTGIKYAFDTYTASQSTITTTNANKQITENVRSLKTVYAVQQIAADKINVFRQARLKTILWKYGSIYVPSQALSGEFGAAEILKETIKAVNLSNDQSYDVDIGVTGDSGWSDTWDNASTKFIIGQNFELSPSQSMSGADATRKPLSVQLTYSESGVTQFNPAKDADSAITLTTFVHYDVIAIFGPSGTQLVY